MAPSPQWYEDYNFLKLKLPKGNIEENLGDFDFGNDFLIQHQNDTPWKVDKLDFIKIKYVFSVKDTVKRIKIKSTDWKKTFKEHISEK